MASNCQITVGAADVRHRHYFMEKKTEMDTWCNAALLEGNKDLNSADAPSPLNSHDPGMPLRFVMVNAVDVHLAATPESRWSSSF